MDQAIIIALAKAAGLDRALDLFPADVMAAAAQASGNLAGFSPPQSPTAEPWPPMKAGTNL